MTDPSSDCTNIQFGEERVSWVTHRSMRERLFTRAWLKCKAAASPRRHHNAGNDS